jgi:hypothetical protein
MTLATTQLLDPSFFSPGLLTSLSRAWVVDRVIRNPNPVARFAVRDVRNATAKKYSDC